MSFMETQVKVSHDLVRLMQKDHEERVQMFEEILVVNHQLRELLLEKDKQIAKLNSTIEAMKVLSNDGA